MIEVYPVRVEAVEDGNLLFHVEAFDECSATLKMEMIITPAILDDLFAAIRRSVELLELKEDREEARIDILPALKGEDS